MVYSKYSNLIKYNGQIPIGICVEFPKFAKANWN